METEFSILVRCVTFHLIGFKVWRKYRAKESPINSNFYELYDSDGKHRIMLKLFFVELRQKKGRQ